MINQTQETEYIKLRTSKKMLLKWDTLHKNILNDNLVSINLIPNYYKKLMNDFDLCLIEMNKRFYDIGSHSELMFKVNKIKSILKSLEVLN